MIGFERSQLCPFETFRKYNYVSMQCTLHYFIYYVMTIPVKSLITRRSLKRYSYALVLKVKHLYRYVHNDLNHVFLYICIRILIGSTIRPLKVKFISNSQMNKTVQYILSIICMYVL